MKALSWGNYPKIATRELLFDKESTLREIVGDNDELIAYGNGRSYGDSALSKSIIRVMPHNYFLEFNREKGVLHVQSGVLLSEIMDVYIPMGWFLKIVPGTKYITIGGAIASDVHGKNHHVEGCFSECVLALTLMLPDGEVVECSKGVNTELFKATCGGMGLTGVILDAKISLKPIRSKQIKQVTIKTKNLRETFDGFDRQENASYSVAWIDCLSSGKRMGRCLLMSGEFGDDGDLGYKPKSRLNVPFYFPSVFLNKFTVKAFNFLYYHRVRSVISEKMVDIDQFFFPLDGVENWNRIYGRRGFLQYQFILPKSTSYKGLEEVLKMISLSGKGSFLAVLKLYGKSNNNYLSFPLEGYSLALDFKIEKGVFELLDRLDEIILKYNGRIYLAKDARMSRKTFEQGYPLVEKFRGLRKKNSMATKFNSLQSRRLGI